MKIQINTNQLCIKKQINNDFINTIIQINIAYK